MSKKPEKVMKDLCAIGGPDIMTTSVDDLADTLQSRNRGTRSDYVPLILMALKEGWFKPKYQVLEDDKPAKLVGYTPNRQLEEGESAPKRANAKTRVLSLKPSRFRRIAPATASVVAQ